MGKKELLSGEALAKAQAGFSPVTASVSNHKAPTAPHHANSNAGQVSTPVGAVLSDYAVQASSNSQSSTSDHHANTSRSAAELIAMTDASARDVRLARNEFAMHMAYRSTHTFRPNDAMLEISRAARDGHMKLELTLEPATLGKIQVSLQTDATKQIQVHMLVDQSASKQVLEQQLPQLRQALANQGLELAGFSMNMNSQQQQEHDGSPKAFAGNTVHEDGMHVLAPSENTMPLGMNIAEHGRLNILA